MEVIEAAKVSYNNILDVENCEVLLGKNQCQCTDYDCQCADLL